MLDDDGLPLDEVGPWAKEKHERLRQYVDITREARRKFVEGSGGATYIDLYCGSGRAIIRDTVEKIDGSPLVAFKAARDGGVAFSEIHIADDAEELCRAAEKRIMGTSNNTSNWRLERRLIAGAHRSCSGGACSGAFSRPALHREGNLRDATQTPPTHSAQAGAAATRSS